MKSDKNFHLPPEPVLPWKPVHWENIPRLPWPHQMVNLAEAWSKFYPCNHCGFCCTNPPLIKIENDIASYLPKNEDGYCIMYDKEKKRCTIHEKRPLECRLLVCRAPESFKKRMEKLLVRFLKEYASQIEKNISDDSDPDEAVGKVFGGDSK